MLKLEVSYEKYEHIQLKDTIFFCPDQFFKLIVTSCICWMCMLTWTFYFDVASNPNFGWRFFCSEDKIFDLPCGITIKDEILQLRAQFLLLMVTCSRFIRDDKFQWWQSVWIQTSCIQSCYLIHEVLWIF